MTNERLAEMLQREPGERSPWRTESVNAVHKNAIDGKLEGDAEVWVGSLCYSHIVANQWIDELLKEVQRLRATK